MCAVPSGLPAQDERRQHPRIILKAYAGNHTCSYQINGAQRTARLVDISPGGARLCAVADPPPPGVGESLRLVQDFLTGAGLKSLVSGTVRWVTESDFGIAFSQELPLSVGELQRLVD